MINKINGRQLPEKTCPQCTGTFFPKRKNQIYCSEQHQIDAANDRRGQNDQSYNQRIKILKQNRKALETIWKKLTDMEKESFHVQLLQLFDYYFEFSTEITVNERTGIEIHWSDEYGIEPINMDKDIFKHILH